MSNFGRFTDYLKLIVVIVGKQAIELKNYTLVKLSNSIPADPGKGWGIEHFRYSSLKNFIKASSVKDLKE
jgi:hypothetical protein